MSVRRVKRERSYSVPCRCTKCGTRQTLGKLPKYYIRPRRCPKCGNRKWYVDKWMRTRGTKQKCNCTGWWFPHRRGCKHCDLSPTAEQDAAERYGNRRVA